MRIAFGKSEIELQTLQDEARLRALLSSCQLGSILLQGRFTKAAFYAIIVRVGRAELGDRGRFGIGLACADFGLSPMLALEPEQDRLLVGYDMDLAAIDLAKGRIVFAVQLDAPFYAIRQFHDRDWFLVFHEIGVMAVNSKGGIIWRFSRDIVQGVAFAEDSLTLSFMESDSVTLDLLSGTERLPSST